MGPKPSMKIGDIFPTKKHGYLRVLRYKDSARVLVKFINTGFIVESQASVIRDLGNLRDRLAPSLYGVGILGYKSDISMKAKNVWVGMLGRCYNIKDGSYSNYGANGVTVCESWLNRSTFGRWYDLNHPTDGFEYHLDKDKKVNGNKIYSPKTCCFIFNEENAVLANAKHYKMVNPQGEIIKFYNMRKFCRDNDLTQQCLQLVSIGKQSHHKGWKLPEVQ